MTRPRATTARLAILDASAQAIGEHGFHGMSMRELAKATGQSLANFYNHFDSKEDVLFEIQRNAFETLIVSAAESVAGVGAPAERLFAFMYQHVRYVAEHPSVMRVLVQEAGALPSKERKVVRALKQRYYQILRGIIDDLSVSGCEPGSRAAPSEVDEAELERLTYSVFGMLNWVYGWYEPDRHGSAGTVARSLHRVALCGLVARCPVRVFEGVPAVERRLSIVEQPSLLDSGRHPG
jgi:AcrR family transcriptional regulator